MLKEVKHTFYFWNRLRHTFAWATILLILVACLLLSACQIPQVPEYAEPPRASDVWVAYLDGLTLTIIRADGTNVIPLARNLQPTECAPYYVSPNGQWIAYQQANSGLWIASTVGEPGSRLSDAMVGSVSWFPDSSGIVYTLENEVYAQWLDESQPPQALAVGGRRYFFPTWSPDGKYIAFLETTDEANVYNVILIQSDSSGWRTLGSTAPGSAEQPLCPNIIAWSPDSTRFLVDFGDPAFIFYVSGGSPVQAGSGATPSQHTWSPDGRNLAYLDETSRLWIVKSSGGQPVQLTNLPVSQAIWSPHASRIAYIAQRDDDTQLEIVNTETGEIRSITGADTYIESEPYWTPDGSALIFVRHTIRGQRISSAGIWLASADGASPAQRLTLAGEAIQVFAIRQ
jgi:Tol biopolymer transport system component